MAKLESETNENLTNIQHEDIDDDDDQLNSSHKVVPHVYQPSAAGTDKQETQLPKEPSTTTVNPATNFNYDIQSWIKKDVKKYINTAIPKDYTGFVQCHIKRDKEGLTKGFFATYSLYFDGQNENDKTFLLIARKHITIGGHSEFFIGTDAENPSKNLNEETCIAKLRGVNLTSTEYILYEHNSSSNEQKNKQQTAAIVYDDNIFGPKAPRKMIILLLNSEKTTQPLKEGETIINEWKAGRLTDFNNLVNKQPTYDEESKAYRLTLNENRVKLPSHKNFQLTSVNADHEETSIMQFGRIDENNFALDYRHPLTAVQAFGIALSSFHNRFRT